MRAWILLCALLAGLPASGRADAPYDASWSGTRSMNDIAVQLTFSPRSIGTPGHEKEIEYITSEMAKAYPEPARLQRWDYHSEDGQVFHMTNIVARFYPQAARRIILGTHYDSIIRAYRDQKDPTGIMPGANNSASGVAVLLETARALKSLPPPAVGIDFVFFDGEEGPRALGAGDPRWKAIGSPYFTQHLADFYRGAKPVAAAIFDMVGYRDLVLDPERDSLMAAGDEVARFWRIGHEVAPPVFVAAATETPISDDHTALNLAGIPSFLVIDFEYEPWFNTTQDTIDKCSARSLEAVGRTTLRYAYGFE